MIPSILGFMKRVFEATIWFQVKNAKFMEDNVVDS